MKARGAHIYPLGDSRLLLRNTMATSACPVSRRSLCICLFLTAALSTSQLGVRAFAFQGVSCRGKVDSTIHTSAFPRWKIHQRCSLSMSFEGNDTPSDMGDASAEVPATDDNPELREMMKRELMTIAALSNRGQVASQEESDAAMDLVYQLEARNPTPDATNLNAVGGVWELVYSDTQPFRSSPFFMAVGELFGEEKDRAETLFALHRAATANGEIGRVRQTINEVALVSEIDLKVGFTPGIPLAVSGTVVTKAKLTPVSNETFSLKVEGTKVTNNNIFSFLDGTVEVPLEQIYTSLRGSVPESKLSTFYLDENMRISRTADDHVFVYVRASTT